MLFVVKLTLVTGASAQGVAPLAGPDGTMQPPQLLLERVEQQEWIEVLILLKEDESSSGAFGPPAAKPLAALRGADYERRISERRAALDALKDRALLRFTEPGNLEPIARYSVVPVIHARIRTASQLNRLARDPEVLSVEEVIEVEPMLAESLPLIEQPMAQWAGHDGTGTAVCVIDSGVDYTRDAFGNCTTVDGQPAGANCKVAYVQDFAPDDGLLDDSTLHGTNVSGIVLGAAPETRIIGLDVFEGDSGSSSYIIGAIDWCIVNRAAYGIAAINMSLGTSSIYANPVPTTDAWGSSIANAIDAGIAVVAASGNSAQTSGISLPAAYVGVVSVGAVYDADLGSRSWSVCTDSSTWADQVTCFSNSADFLTLLAPGALITAADLTMGGTSMAAPFVAGAFAVLRQIYPEWTVSQTTQRLRDSGLSITDPRNNLTFPRLNLKTATGTAPAQQQSLDISLTGTGTGVVTSEPAGISCGTTCTATFGEGSSVTLSATAAGNSVFSGWGGACSDNQTPGCTLTMDQDRTVSAAFDIVALELENGSVVTDLEGTVESERHFYLEVPEGATNLLIRISGGTGDADLYVRWGNAPTLSEYDCRPWIDGNEEGCSILSPVPGTYYVMVQGWTDYAGVSLSVSFDVDAPLCPYDEDVTVPGQIVTDTVTFSACSTITTEEPFTVRDGGSATLKAGSRAILRPGVRVLPGGSLSVNVGSEAVQ